MKRVLAILLVCLYILSIASCVIFNNAYAYGNIIILLLLTFIIIKNKDNSQNAMNLFSIIWFILSNAIVLLVYFIYKQNLFETSNVIDWYYGLYIILSLSFRLLLKR